MQQHSSAEIKGLDVVELQNQLETRCFGVGNKLFYLPVVDSTNTVAMQLANEGAEEGVVVLADTQTAGRGRQGRRWVDVFGCNVLSSTLLRPLFPPHFLVMLASLAVSEAVTETCGIPATIKWPNDVLVRERKVAGILIETSHDRSGQLVAVLGIGVNVNGHMQGISPGGSLITGQASDERKDRPEPVMLLAPAATTLEAECGHAVSREMFIARLLWHIETAYLSLQQEAADPLSSAYGLATRSIWQRWRAKLTTLGRSIQVRQGDTVISGVAEDVDGNGELLLRRHSGTLVSITWGDVS